MKCSVCKTRDATHMCGKCEMVVYCGEQCANQDWVQIHAKEHSSEEHSADEIIRGRLWVGGLEALHDKTLMSRIKAVVSAVPEERFEEERLKEILGPKKDIFRVPIEDADDAPIEEYFEGAAAFIDKHLREGHTVLVHCVAGHSRSVSLVLYYLMKYKRYTLKNAFALVRKKRPTIKVNKGFRKKLKQVEARAADSVK